MRLKLSGARVRRIAFPRWLTSLYCGPTSLRPRPVRPQLKHVSLGGRKTELRLCSFQQAGAVRHDKCCRQPSYRESSSGRRSVRCNSSAVQGSGRLTCA